MRKISGYKSISGKYNIQNRADFLKKLDELQHEELKTKFAIKISQEENNQDAIDKFSKDLEEISGDIDSLCMLLGRDAEIRSQLLEEWNKQDYEELKASFGIRFAHREGNYDVIQKFINDFDDAKNAREAVEELINSDEVYHDEEENEEELENEEIDSEENEEIIEDDKEYQESENSTEIDENSNNSIEKMGFFKKEGIYTKDKIKKSFEKKQKQKLLNAPSEVEVEDRMRVIQWSEEEKKAVEKLGYMNKNDKRDLYMSESPKDGKREDFKMTLEIKSNEEEKEDEHLKLSERFKNKKREDDDERDIG